MLTKKKNKGQVISPELFFYIIPLDEGRLKLTWEMLNKHFEAGRTRELYYGNSTIPVAYSRGILTIATILKGQAPQQVHVHIEPDHLHVACTCGMPDRQLCAHAYIALYNLVWTGGTDLRRYCWPGYDANEKVQDKFLHVELNDRLAIIKARPQFGKLFKPNVPTWDGHQYLMPKNRGLPVNLLKGERDVLGFGLLYGDFHNNLCELPVLLPLVLRTSKDNFSTTIFQQLMADGTANGIELTDRQLELRSIAEDMRQLREPLGYWQYDPERSEDRALKKAFLLLWERALPILIAEAYCYEATPPRIRYKKGKVDYLKRSHLTPCTFSPLRPQLYFVLREHADHFALTVHLSVKGMELKYRKRTNLFVMDEDNRCYLMPSAEADDLFNWMNGQGNRVTILKEHMEVFRIRFLRDLLISYPVYQYLKGERRQYLNAAN
ncbi:hypothetical protein LJ707_09015 [Mucilaginibacter sp. UR6-1]|uniref:hypothetical protein n=1 Tax=Mucilaginibacter sp. UR6-1 TaxID=1435643 RepID=UPI001E370433|nr:hypothetical protein [Mucilaginibacter sp. UR6-1]MCC8409069.1 hypothetical protein [Mucilaginibacter sp. UR6-1]